MFYIASFAKVYAHQIFQNRLKDFYPMLVELLSSINANSLASVCNLTIHKVDIGYSRVEMGESSDDD